VLSLGLHDAQLAKMPGQQEARNFAWLYSMVDYIWKFFFICLTPRIYSTGTLNCCQAPPNMIKSLKLYLGGRISAKSHHKYRHLWHCDACSILLQVTVRFMSAFNYSVTIAVIVKLFPLPCTRPIRGDMAIPESTAPITFSDTQLMSFKVRSIQIECFWK
jgi:hypothetical protein